jgi:exonuclease SbcC
LARLPTATPIEVAGKTRLDELRRELETRDEERILTDLSRTRAELRAAAERWRSLPAEDSSHDRASKERREQAAAEALGAWRVGAGKELDEIVTTLRATFSDLPTIDDDPEESRAIAERRAEVEAMQAAPPSSTTARPRPSGSNRSTSSSSAPTRGSGN